MNGLAIPSQAMSSREIAELVDSRHDKVKQSIERLVAKGVIAQPPMGDGPKAANGVVERHYLVGKRDSYVIVAQLSPEFTARLVDRWQQLEAEAVDPMRLLADPASMRTLLLSYTEKVLALESQVGNLNPKAEALERIAEADGLMNPTSAAKALQVPPNRLFNFMRTNEWVYRRAGARSDVAYQDKIAAGYLTHKVHIARREDGSEKVCEQVMVTAKGLAKLAQAIGSH